MKAMLLAAGFGQRLRPHTLNRAKPALEFLGLPLISYPLALLETLPQLDEVVINTHHCPGSVEKAIDILASQAPYKITFANEKDGILGSGGGIAANKYIFESEECFVVANADELLFLSHSQGLNKILSHHKSSGALATLLTCQHPEAGKSFGAVWCDPDKQIKAFGKKISNPQLKPMHFTGFQIFSARIFDYLPPGPSHIFLDALVPAIANQELVLSYEEDQVLWWETGNEASFLEATKLALASLAENPILFEHLQHHLGPLTQVQNGLWSVQPDYQPTSNFMGLLGKATAIDATAQITGFLVLGKNSSIHSNINVSNSVVGADLDINKNLIGKLHFA